MYPDRAISTKPLILLAVAAVMAIGAGCGILVLLAAPPGGEPIGPGSAPIAGAGQ